jgi:hypothetical protein
MVVVALRNKRDIGIREAVVGKEQRNLATIDETSPASILQHGVSRRCIEDAKRTRIDKE